MTQSVPRVAVALFAATIAVSACGGASSRGDKGASGASDTTAAGTPPLGGQASPDAPDIPAKTTPFTHGEIHLTYGKPLTWKLRQGKLVETPSEQYGNVEAIFVDYSPDGTLAGNGYMAFNAGRAKTGGYHVDDLTINSHGGWRISQAAHCAITMAQATPAGIRGTITCPGDPKGPTGPITFTAMP